MHNFKGKHILIIGGTGGIGNDAARAFVELGASVSVTSRKGSDAGPDVLTMDVRDEAQVASAVAGAIQAHGPIDVVVYAPTAPVRYGTIAQKTWANMQEHLEVQAKGFFSVVQSLMDQMKQGTKTKFIVLLTEYCIGNPPAGYADYVSAKYALMGLGKTMAMELARYGSTVNFISPGMVDTDLIADVPKKAVEMEAAENPMKRIGRPEDVTGAILYLASSGADYVNGANITINGGNVML
jgi:3-oxoacyl-[acyl-carrier protein] reductase